MSVISQPNHDATFGTIYSAARIGNTFTAGATAEYLASVAIWLYRVGTPGTVTMTLYATSGGIPSGSALATATIDGNPLTTATSGQECLFTFATPYNLTANTKYAFIVTSTGTSTNAVKILSHTPSTYAGGNSVYWNGSTYVQDTTYDIGFTATLYQRLTTTHTLDGIVSTSSTALSTHTLDGIVYVPQFTATHTLEGNVVTQSTTTHTLDGIVTKKLANDEINLSSTSGTFTHVDPSGKLIEAEHRVRGLDLASNSNTYHYRAENISGDFVHYLTAGFDDLATRYVVWAASDTIGNLGSTLDAATKTLAVYFKYTNSEFRLYLGERDGSYTDSSQYVVIPPLYRYRPLFFKIERVSNVLTVKVYREPALLHLLFTITKTLNSVQDYDYLYVAMNDNATETVVEQLASTGNLITIFGDVKAGNTFTATASGSLTSVTLKLFRTGTLGNITASIYTTSVTTGKPTTTIRATQVVDGSAITTDTNGEDVTFNFATPTTLTKGTVYAVILSDGTDEANNVHLCGAANTSYTGGQYAYNTIGPWNLGAGYDAYFKAVIAATPVSSAFSGNLYLNSEPSDVFEEAVSTLLIHPELEDHFNNFPTSDITWTTGANGTGSTIAVDTWSSDEDGHSVKITAASTGDSFAYVPTVSPAYAGGSVTADIKITELASGKRTPLVGLYVSATRYAVAYAENVSGTIYFRIGYIDGGSFTTSTSTRITGVLGETYNLVLTFNNRSTVSGPGKGFYLLTIDGYVAEEVSVGDSANVTRVYIGNLGFNTYHAATRYIDNLKFMCGRSLFPGIARGGDNQDTLVVGFTHDLAQAVTPGCKAYFYYSKDDGKNWTYFHTDTAAANVINSYNTIRWCPQRNSWLVFMTGILYPLGGLTFDTRVYEVTDIETTPVWNLRLSGSVQGIFPEREFTEDGLLYVGLSDWDYPDNMATGNYLSSALFNPATGALTKVHKFAKYNDVPGAAPVDEPTIWHDDNGVMYGGIRHDAEHVLFRYRVSPDNGNSDWDTTTLYDPGADFDHRTAALRAFTFRGYAYWQGRDDQPDSTNINSWSTFIMKTEKNPVNVAVDPTIPIVAEMWWESMAEGGNGDIDGKTSTYGNVYLDFVSSLNSMAYYKRVNSGEVGIIIEDLTHTLDGFISDTYEETHTLDGLVVGQYQDTHTLDGIVKATIDTTHTLDGIVKEVKESTHTLDGILLGYEYSTYTLDGLVYDPAHYSPGGYVKLILVDGEPAISIGGINYTKV